MIKIEPIRWSKKGWRFISHDMWHLTNEDIKGSFLFFVNIAKALFLSLRFFFSERLMEKASALTYYTLLSIVPIVAVMLGIAKGFNLDSMIQDSLLNSMPAQQDTIKMLFNFANSYLEHTETGVVMGIGVVLLLWVIISLIGNIETVFNIIWQQPKDRSTIRKMTDYLAIIIMVPLFIILSSGLDIFITTYLKSSHLDYTISEALISGLHWARYLLIYLAFTTIYIVIPNTKVKFMNALIAALVAGSIFMLFEWMYINGQIWVSKYNAIYGSFAALPLLLLFIQMSWVICLYGAELSYAAQNIQNYNYEKDIQNISNNYYEFLLVIISGIIFNNDKKPKLDQDGEAILLTTEEICKRMHLPSKLVNKVLSDLRDLEVIGISLGGKEKETPYWNKGEKVGYDLTVSELIEKIDGEGTNKNIFRYDHEGSFSKEYELLKNMREAQLAIAKDYKLSDIEMQDLIRKED